MKNLRTTDSLRRPARCGSLNSWHRAFAACALLTRVAASLLVSCLLVLALVPALSADSLSARLRGDHIFVVPPKLDLMRPAIFARLKNGGTVTYDFHVALWVGNRQTVRRRAFERFIVSYDLWEEKFAISGLRKPRAGVTNVDSRSIAAWCAEHIAIPAGDIKPHESIWLKLEIRAADPKKDPALLDEGLNLINLVEILSRPSRAEQQRWSFESAELRPAELRR